MFQHVSAAVLRATALPRPVLDRWPTLGPGPDQHGLDWLLQTWEDGDSLLAAAVRTASPVLAARIDQICTGAVQDPDSIRRVALSLLRYRLRAAYRATPFGLFAGVAPARLGDPDQARVLAGCNHRVQITAPAAWLDALTDRLEADRQVRQQLTVVANALATESGGAVALALRPGVSSPAHVSVRTTGPIRAVMNTTRRPVFVADLVKRLCAAYPATSPTTVDHIVSGLLREQLLVSNLRAPMTADDPIAHLITQLEWIDAVPAAALLAQLREIVVLVDQARSDPFAPDAQERRTAAAEAMHRAHPLGKQLPVLGLTLRLDWDVTLPAEVGREVEAAAAALVRLAPQSGRSPWSAWHQAFLERYGPHAQVPLLDVLDEERGLGLPAGYPDKDMSPFPRALTRRDRALLRLAQGAAITGQQEVVLDDADVDRLSELKLSAAVRPGTELTIRVHAAGMEQIARGEFTLSLISASRAPGTMTGRFLAMLGLDEQRAVRDAPTAVATALPTQISAAPLTTLLRELARAPRLLAASLPLAELPEVTDKTAIAAANTAVSADAQRLYLVDQPTGRVLEPRELNAIGIARTDPIPRFLAELPHALSVACAPFDWGAAEALPFLPAIRCRRTLLSPARWRLAAADLPAADAAWSVWDEAFLAWAQSRRLPELVHAGQDDQVLLLDLAELSHRVLLRDQLKRAETKVIMLRAAPHDPTPGWLPDHAHELVVTLYSTAAPAAVPTWPAKAGGRHSGHLPGCDDRISMHLYARATQQTAILTGHLPELFAALPDGARLWFLRYRDPSPNPRPHLRIRIYAPGAGQAAMTAAARWGEKVRDAGLSGRVTWETYYPETARFGGPNALDFAEALFAADSTVAVALLGAAVHTDCDIRTLTATSMFNLVAALLGDPLRAQSWLIENTRPTAPPPPRHVYRHALALADPTDQTALRTLPRGEVIKAAWETRHAALADYRAALERVGMTAEMLLPDLLHLHHVRIVGPDQQHERQCLHLARAAALSQAARTRGTRP